MNLVLYHRLSIFGQPLLDFADLQNAHRAAFTCKTSTQNSAHNTILLVPRRGGSGAGQVSIDWEAGRNISYSKSPKPRRLCFIYCVSYSVATYSKYVLVHVYNCCVIAHIFVWDFCHCVTVFCISRNQKEEIIHCIINRGPDGYGFAEPFMIHEQLMNLVLHYRETSLAEHNPSLESKLLYPAYAPRS